MCSTQCAYNIGNEKSTQLPRLQIPLLLYLLAANLPIEFAISISILVRFRGRSSKRRKRLRHLQKIGSLLVKLGLSLANWIYLENFRSRISTLLYGITYTCRQAATQLVSIWRVCSRQALRSGSSGTRMILADTAFWSI